MVLGHTVTNIVEARNRSNPSVLKYLNPEKRVVLLVDASKNVLEAVCHQDSSPVAYASRLITETEGINMLKSRKNY